MSQAIPEEIIDEIRQRIDLVSVIGEYLKLERRGKNMVGLCPFHQEKTPSFTVSPEKQLYHCFGCGASGNVFSLIMQIENMSFPEAARFLARRTGVNIPEATPAATAEDNFKEQIYRVNDFAARFYSQCLKKTAAGKKTLQYLSIRGINEESIERFKLGYAPADWTAFFLFARKKGVEIDLMVKAGLVSPGRNNSYYDRFRNRLIFPIFNVSGKVAGFGGRALEEKNSEGPKYLNSPETPVFDKGKMLYGLNLARETMRREKKAIVVEGYTDVIASHQAGIKNTVASLGTALTNEQSRLLRQQAETVITAYDADTAGEAATWRGLAILQSTGCLVQIADLPMGSDPDSLIRTKGPEAFRMLTEKAIPLMEYRLRQLKRRFDLATEQGRVSYLEELMPFLIAAVNQVEQDYYLKKAAEELGVEEDSLRSELKKRRSSSRRIDRPEQDQLKISEEEMIRIRPAEKILLSLMLQSKEIADLGRNLLAIEFLDDSRVKMIFEEIGHLVDKHGSVSAEQLLNRFSEPQVKRLITEVVTDPALQDLEPQKAKRMTEDCLHQLRQVWTEQMQRELQKKIKVLEALGSNDELAELLRQEQDLIMKKNDGSYRFGKGGDFGG